MVLHCAVLGRQTYATFPAICPEQWIQFWRNCGPRDRITFLKCASCVLATVHPNVLTIYSLAPTLGNRLKNTKTSDLIPITLGDLNEAGGYDKIWLLPSIFCLNNNSDNNNNVHLSCSHQRPERSHDTY